MTRRVRILTILVAMFVVASVGLALAAPGDPLSIASVTPADGTTHTLRETAKHFNITRERVRQIEAAAMKKMREYMLEQERQVLAART